LKARVLFGVDTPEGPPTPKFPFQCPDMTKKKGTILLLFEFYIHLQPHQDLTLQCRRVMGQKLRYGRPCPHDSPGTHNWLARPQLLPFLQHSTKYLMLALSWKVGANGCSFGLTQPAACTGALVPPTFGHVHRRPFHPICSIRVAIDWA
jgi:hypothetical protein